MGSEVWFKVEILTAKIFNEFKKLTKASRSCVDRYVSSTVFYIFRYHMKLWNTGSISGITLCLIFSLIFLNLKMTWDNQVHFYIRLTKPILKQHNCLTQQVSTFRCEITPPSAQAELSPCLSPVIIICSLLRWLSATTYPLRLTSENTNTLWGLICCGGERENKNKNFMLA